MSCSRPYFGQRPRSHGGVELQAPDELDELERLTNYILFGAMTNSERQAVQEEDVAATTREEARKKELARHGMSRKKAKKVCLVATASSATDGASLKQLRESIEQNDQTAINSKVLGGMKGYPGAAEAAYVTVALGDWNSKWGLEEPIRICIYSGLGFCYLALRLAPFSLEQTRRNLNMHDFRNC